MSNIQFGSKVITGKSSLALSKTITSSVEVSWMARNLGSYLNPGLANHHYILIIVNGISLATSIQTITYKGIEFMTLGGFKVNDYMVFSANDPNDVASVKDVLNNTPIKDYFNPFDWEAQKRKVTPPSGSGLQFAGQVLQLASNYEKNTRATPFKYSLLNANCASWVNTLFKVAGVSANDRIKLGQFIGIDAGEQQLIPEKLFN